MIQPADLLAARRRAAQAALELLPDVGIIGLGSGATASLFIEGVAQALASGQKKLTGVATSEHSRQFATSLGIPLHQDDGPWDIAICVDGADEVTDGLDLIKGGGGCHMREKIVNAASRFNVIVVDEAKLSRRLGQRWVVPVEVTKFGHAATAVHLAKWGKVSQRWKQGEPWITDSGNFIYDVNAGIIEDPGFLEQTLTLIPGVVETGLFVGRTDLLLIGTADGVRRIAVRESD